MFYPVIKDNIGISMPSDEKSLSEDATFEKRLFARRKRKAIAAFRRFILAAI